MLKEGSRPWLTDWDSRHVKRRGRSVQQRRISLYTREELDWRIFLSWFKLTIRLPSKLNFPLLFDSIWGIRVEVCMFYHHYPSCTYIIESTNPIRRNWSGASGRESTRPLNASSCGETFPIQFDWSLPLHKVLTGPAFPQEFLYAILPRLFVCVCVYNPNCPRPYALYAGHE